ncbi:alpha/beta fold hydrolase [Psychromonas antarctica]|uniref:alpha/beta fold hydrolase n=1 Tax=Psychromonas antarctica TaxID=67573 RepID=UPI001EE9069D|nr:alpha/beta fold hydrolase [Psychromonas antarctica]MCG6202501.1 alpha/beta fold hydrolase [Psychromonas antarctica]
MKLIYEGPVDGPLFIFAHGAGAGADSTFMVNIAQGLALRGIRVARFNFPYMQQLIDSGKRRPPERAPKLIAQFATLIADIDKPIVIGGKSMGGRIATLLAAQLSSENKGEAIKGVACLGFPFHPVGKTDKLRTEHFPLIKQDLLIVQGERDTMGNKQEVEHYGLPDTIDWLWLEDGDHDLKPRVKSGFTQQSHLQRTMDKLAAYIKNAVTKG